MGYLDVQSRGGSLHGAWGGARRYYRDAWGCRGEQEMGCTRDSGWGHRVHGDQGTFGPFCPEKHVVVGLR